MKYLICQEWRNTASNHAGMKHMVLLLKKYYPDDYEIVVFPQILLTSSSLGLRKNNILYQLYLKFLSFIFIPYLYKNTVRKLRPILSKDDTIYFLEYCEKMTPTYQSVKYLKKHCPQTKVFGMIHLVPEKLGKAFSTAQINKYIKPLDRVLTLGTSLTDYFLKYLSISENKLKTLFHYVDLDYYKALDKKKEVDTPRILVQGNQARNFDLLLKVVNNNPQVEFVICQGVLDLKDKFFGCSNVKLIGFVEESELRAIMQNSEVSLNIMDDTIGSNVIVTSMAMGLAMIVSDVGSIRDYCRNDGAIYCDNNKPEEFGEAIKELTQNRKKLLELREKSLSYSLDLSIHKLHNIL